jgi:hypothetical protein
VAGCCECGDERLGSCATELVTNEYALCSVLYELLTLNYVVPKEPRKD